MSKVLGPVFSQLASVQQCILLTAVADQLDQYVPPYILKAWNEWNGEASINSMPNRPEAQLLGLYIALRLQKSFADSLREFDNQITLEDRVNLLRIEIYMLQEKTIAGDISESSILEDLLQADLGAPVFRSSFELFDKRMKELIFTCRIEPADRRERIA